MTDKFSEIPATVEELTNWRGLSRGNRIKLKLALKAPSGRQAIDMMLTAIKLAAMDFKEKHGREPTEKEAYIIVYKALGTLKDGVNAQLKEKGVKFKDKFKEKLGVKNG